MIAAVILFLTIVLLPVSMVRAQEDSSSAGAAPAAAAGWDLTKPSSCSMEGPPPCEKCSVTCDAGQKPICTPGQSAPKGQTNSCVRPTSCVCK